MKKGMNDITEWEIQWEEQFGKLNSFFKRKELSEYKEDEDEECNNSAMSSNVSIASPISCNWTWFVDINTFRIDWLDNADPAFRNSCSIVYNYIVLVYLLLMNILYNHNYSYHPDFLIM